MLSDEDNPAGKPRHAKTRRASKSRTSTTLSSSKGPRSGNDDSSLPRRSHSEPASSGECTIGIAAQAVAKPAGKPRDRAKRYPKKYDDEGTSKRPPRKNNENARVTSSLHHSSHHHTQASSLFHENGPAEFNRAAISEPPEMLLEGNTKRFSDPNTFTDSALHSWHVLEEGRGTSRRQSDDGLPELFPDTVRCSFLSQEEKKDKKVNSNQDKDGPELFPDTVHSYDADSSKYLQIAKKDDGYEKAMPFDEALEVVPDTVAQAPSQTHHSSLKSPKLFLGSRIPWKRGRRSHKKGRARTFPLQHAEIVEPPDDTASRASSEESNVQASSQPSHQQRQTGPEAPGAFAIREGTVERRRKGILSLMPINELAEYYLLNRGQSVDGDKDEEGHWNHHIKIGLILVVLMLVGIAIGLGILLSSTRSDSSADMGQPLGTGGNSSSMQTDPFLQCSNEGKILNISEPVEARYQELLQHFIPVTLTEFNEPMVSCSPQNVALVWLAADSLAASGDTMLMRQRYALALLYASWNGDEWDLKEGWLSPESECSWYGVSCNQNTSVVSDVNLTQNLLEGSIPSEISLLDNLRVIDVSGNKLIGELPDELYSITTLEQLILPQNNLEGTISIEVGNLRELRSFRVEYNHFSGMLPNSMKQLSNLKKFDVRLNIFVGPIFDLMLAWPDIVLFDLEDNSFVDTLPSEIGNLSHLTGVDLTGNEITGSLPTELGLISTLEWFLIDGLTGTIPTEAGNLVNLRVFTVTLGDLEGQIPSEFGKLRRLQHLDFGPNKLSGSIPSQLGLCTELRTLDLEYNAIDGALPSELGALTMLQTLDLDSTGVSGTAPTEICILREAELENFYSPCYDFECIPSSCCMPLC